ncbi:hypothetical protein OIU77_026301 [Salix suchowensis]|uniref:Uncharacterized protein n=1 Tax=Salix suchowensis TaxID=1278906 RepID=A0ABQ9BZ82_9ROSI|nr:hypothetical protein OIU77_026301 [Salix suchowensis]
MGTENLEQPQNPKPPVNPTKSLTEISNDTTIAPSTDPPTKPTTTSNPNHPKETNPPTQCGPQPTIGVHNGAAQRSCTNQTNLQKEPTNSSSADEPQRPQKPPIPTHSGEHQHSNHATTSEVGTSNTTKAKSAEGDHNEHQQATTGDSQGRSGKLVCQENKMASIQSQSSAARTEDTMEVTSARQKNKALLLSEDESPPQPTPNRDGILIPISKSLIHAGFS